MNKVSCYFMLTRFFSNDKVSLLNRNDYALHPANCNGNLVDSRLINEGIFLRNLTIRQNSTAREKTYRVHVFFIVEDQNKSNE